MVAARDGKGGEGRGGGGEREGRGGGEREGRVRKRRRGEGRIMEVTARLTSTNPAILVRNTA